MDNFLPGCIEETCESPQDVDLGGTYERGVWKVFSDVVYSQLKVNPYACTIVATAGALTSFTGKVIPYELMTRALENMKRDGKFREGSGAYLKDGVAYMVEVFNTEFHTNITPVQIQLNEFNIVNAFKKDSPVITGIRYGKGYMDDEQDNAIIDKGITGGTGHAIYICKINTLDDFLIKYVESYFGEKSKYGVAKDIILMDFQSHRGLFFNTGFYLTK